MKKQTKYSPELEATAFCIVGVGASAGGLEAFTELLKHLPTDTGLGFVLVQHLDPQHESSLTQILTRATSMPVHEITNNSRVEPNHVYVIPPNTRLSIAQGVLKLHPRQPSHTPTRSVDGFLESLAQDKHERAIGVILSGTATDGTLGLEAIKAEGGITFAQDDSARYGSMPRSAEAAGCVDFVLKPEDIAKELARIAKHPFVAKKPAEPPHASKAERETKPVVRHGENGYRKILLLLRNHSRVDFSLYKSTTIQRRVTRRMVLNKEHSLEDYARFLRGNATELDALYSDCLISVTSFFRNPNAFEFLKRKIFPALLKHRGDEPVRVWVLGCSTGQEAYSLAMAFQEVAEKVVRSRKVQVFATDLNDALLDKARHGFYARSHMEDVSPERLRRFFVEEEGGYRIVKSLRESVVFARQNLISDPPFSRMDLISCRNVLIYLEPGLQKKVMPMFHYALKPDGFLFLGASESVGEFTELFEPADRKHKIYSKKAAPTQAFQLPVKARRGERSPAALPLKDGKAGLPEGLRGETNAQREADRVMVTQFAPPGVLINAEMQILQFRGGTSAYLEPPTGKASFDVLKMAREGLMLPLRAAINKAKKDGKTARKENVPVRQNGSTRTVNIEVIPLNNLRERCFLVLFQDADGRARPRGALTAAPPKGRKESPGRVKHLESELSETRDYMQSIQEQHEAANEELQASNEEVQSANEELQSLNEELETSKEELESANEELTTLNEEMANRNAELQRNEKIIAAARDYAEAIVRTVPNPLLILDADLRVQKANETFYKTFKVSRAESEGRLIYDLGNRQWNIPELRELLENILPGRGVFNDFEVTHEFEKIGARTMLLNARTLEAAEGQSARILLAIHDLTERRQAEQVITALKDQLTADLAGMHQLQAFSTRLVRQQDLHTLFGEILNAAIKLTGADLGNIQLLDRATRVLKIVEQRGFDQEFLDFFNSAQEGTAACGTAMERGQRVIVADVANDPIFKGTPACKVMLKAGVRAVQSTPLVGRSGKPLGMFSTHYRSPHRPDERQLQRLDLLARQAADLIELLTWQNELESRVAQQKTQLQAEADERKRLEAEVAEAVEGEQLRLGQELHDGLTQELTGIGMLLEVLKSNLKKHAPAYAAEADSLRRMLAQARDSARSLAKGFYPVEIDKYGLPAALEELARRTQERFGIPCVVEADKNALAGLKDMRGIQLFRVAQEAIHNAVKHAKPKHIHIRMATQDGNYVLTVKDDGLGLPKEALKAKGMGLRIMQHRAHMLGGTLSVRNHDGGGVMVSCIAPDGQTALEQTGAASQ